MKKSASAMLPSVTTATCQSDMMAHKSSIQRDIMVAKAQKRRELAGKKVELKDIGNYEQVLETFKKYDVDGNGVMSYKELHNLMCSLNPGRWSEAESDRLLLQIDKNKNGVIEVNEFISYVFDTKDVDLKCAPKAMSQYEKVMQQFRAFDHNRNGTLDKVEFTRLMGSLKEGWTAAQTAQVFAAVDVDGSGEVDMNELVAYLFGIPAEVRKAVTKGKGALLIVQFTIGPGRPEIFVQQMANHFKKTFGEEVMVSKLIRKDGNGVMKVCARNGEVVFWDDASMLPYRNNPFLTVATMQAWTDEMTKVHIPRLLQSSKVALPEIKAR